MATPLLDQVNAGLTAQGQQSVTGPQLLDMVTATLPPFYKQSIPTAEGGFNSIQGIGQAFSQDLNLMNAWFDAWNRIGLVLFDRIELTNPFAEFKKGVMPLGAAIEELAVDVAEEHQFAPGVAETQLYKREKPKLKAIVHTAERKVFYKQTLQQTLMPQMFTSYEQFDEFIYKIIAAMKNGNNKDEYAAIKGILSMAVAKGAMRTVAVDATAANFPALLQTEILTHAKLMQHPNPAYNTGYGAANPGLWTQADKRDLRIFISVEQSVNLDVNFFANLFNVDLASTNLIIKEVNYFNDVYEYQAEHVVTEADLTGEFLDPELWVVGQTVPAGTAAKAGAAGATMVYDGSNILAIIMDVNALVIYDQLQPIFTTQPNNQGRYINVFLHADMKLSYSPFLPALAIVKASGTQGVELLGADLHVSLPESTDPERDAALAEGLKAQAAKKVAKAKSTTEK